MEELGLEPVDQLDAVKGHEIAKELSNSTLGESQVTSISTHDLYCEVKRLESLLRTMAMERKFVQECYAAEQRELAAAREEVKRIQSVPLFLGSFVEMVDDVHAIVITTHEHKKFVRVLSTLDRSLLRPGASVALRISSDALVDILPPEADSTVKMLRLEDKPKVTYNDIGNCDVQKQEVREAVELPLIHPELYEQLGIDPPRGVLLYGPPGTGKTMLAKAVAHHTDASFISIVASEFSQKYLGDGPKMVRDVFRMAREHAPSIVFIDEVDAIATKRFDSQNGSDREIQRILIELLNQMDGFDQGSNVKVIMATNRMDTLDPAILRPGRLDRKIEFPYPDRRAKRLIFQTITSKMNLADEVDLETFVERPDRISGAVINAICQEAGMKAVRANRYIILQEDFEEAYRKVVTKKDDEFQFYA